MMSVQGTLPTGLAYEVLLETTDDQAVGNGRIMPAHYGESVHGTAVVIGLLNEATGAQVSVTPTGPTLELKPTSALSVLAWLRQHTYVREELGRLAQDEDLNPDSTPEGVVY